jgi:adenine-specific DNA-methyltransferase
MTELVWEGKYVDGKKQSPVRVALPFQTIETVNESAADRQRSLELFSTGRETEWRNRLIWGDKKYVLPSLLPEFAGKVNLIYIDPPFDTGADFSFLASLPPQREEEEETEFLKRPSVIEQKAYRDTWGRGLESYLQWFYDTAIVLRELLQDSASIYVHLDWHVGHYAKVVLDEVFGVDRFRNEIVWSYRKLARTANQFPKSHDTILFYSKNESNVFNVQYVELSESTLKRWGDRKRGGKDPNDRYATDEASEGAVMPDVWAIPLPIGANPQKTGYPTQKPESLLERIILASSNPGDLVLDCFVGSGTTAAVAEKLGRRWIAADLGRFAIHTTRKRLLSIPGLKPFSVQNLGKYERQAWQVAEFPSNGKDRLEEQRQREAAYRKFILDLYHAAPISGQTWLHGVKSGRMVHVGAVDAPVTISDVKAIAREVWKAASGASAKAAVDILGWDFALELNETARNVAAESRVDVAFKKIPREVLEKKAVEQGDVKFFELGALSVDLREKKREVSVKLTDFVIPLDDVPEEARKAIKHWSQMVDYWAVDWDFKEDTFHNQWQSYRTRKEPKIDVQAKYTYAEPGKYRIVVKVIDILGNDTTKTLEVVIK